MYKDFDEFLHLMRLIKNSSTRASIEKVDPYVSCHARLHAMLRC